MLGLLLGTSCKASVQGEAKAGADGANADAFAEFDGQSIEDEKGTVGEFAVAPNQSSSDAALLGARHDVFVKADPVENCTCLSVVAAQPNDSRLGWEARVPQSNPTTQLVVAFRMAGCSDAAASDLGAAYRGYRSAGEDVVIMVERAVSGRPQITGAIVPRPKGRLLVEPYPKSLTYGRSLDGGAQCTVEL
jgi:hypothetical protein